MVGRLAALPLEEGAGETFADDRMPASGPPPPAAAGSIKGVLSSSMVLSSM